MKIVNKDKGKETMRVWQDYVAMMAKKLWEKNKEKEFPTSSPAWDGKRGVEAEFVSRKKLTK